MALALGTASAGAAHNPYDTILERNAFALHVPVVPEPAPAGDTAELRLTGITTFGGKRALIVATTRQANTNTPAAAQWMTLAEGQRNGPVEVLAIDEQARTVKVNNNGSVATLAMPPAGTNQPAASPRVQPATLPTVVSKPVLSDRQVQSLRRILRTYAPQ